VKWPIRPARGDRGQRRDHHPCRRHRGRRSGPAPPLRAADRAGPAPANFSQGTPLTIAARISERLVLIDGAKLARRMVRHNVDGRTRRTYELEKSTKTASPHRGSAADAFAPQRWAGSCREFMRPTGALSSGKTPPCSHSACPSGATLPLRLPPGPLPGAATAAHPGTATSMMHQGQRKPDAAPAVPPRARSSVHRSLVPRVRSAATTWQALAGCSRGRGRAR
jgi:hypothetical protein